MGSQTICSNAQRATRNPKTIQGCRTCRSCHSSFRSPPAKVGFSQSCRALQIYGGFEGWQEKTSSLGLSQSLGMSSGTSAIRVLINASALASDVYLIGVPVFTYDLYACDRYISTNVHLWYAIEVYAHRKCTLFAT